jgi:hypothetical protein
VRWNGGPWGWGTWTTMGARRLLPGRIRTASGIPLSQVSKTSCLHPSLLSGISDAKGGSFTEPQHSVQDRVSGSFTNRPGQTCFRPDPGRPTRPSDSIERLQYPATTAHRARPNQSPISPPHPELPRGDPHFEQKPSKSRPKLTPESLRWDQTLSTAAPRRPQPI